MNILRISFPILFATCCFMNFYEVKAQQKTLEQVKYNFGKHWFSNPDSIKYAPLKVIGITIQDSCNAEDFLSKFDPMLPYLINVEYLALGGTNCFDNSLSTILRFLTLPKLNTIIEYWSCIPSNTVFSNHIRQNLINLSCRSPETEDSFMWMVNLFQLTNLKDLEVFLRGDVRIDDSILKLEHLERLSLCGTGDIRFTEKFPYLKNLKEIKINHCFSCISFPELLPATIERIDISHTGIQKLNSNLCDLSNLKYLDISSTRIKDFPTEQFNFRQLNYFAANIELFTEVEWEEIEQQVGWIKKQGGY